MVMKPATVVCYRMLDNIQKYGANDEYSRDENT